jgi:ATP-dependent exoDNAse (exonuclease V) beta subunit
MMKKQSQPKPNPPYVYVTEASAGGGKTYALARHYLKLLLAKEAPPKKIENILAITFTNKAAREMKERILELLRKIALDKFDNPAEENDLLSKIGIDKKTAQDKSAQIINYILANYSYFQVKTIDSFINMILLGCAYRFGLSSNFKIKEDRLEYLAFCLDECIEQAGHEKNIKKQFDAFLNQYIFLEGKFSWFPKQDMLKIIGALFYDLNTYGGNFKKFGLEGKNIFKEKEKILKLLSQIVTEAEGKANGTFLNTLKNFIEKNPQGFDFAYFTERKTFSEQALPAKAGKTLAPELNRKWQKFHKLSAELSELEARSLFNCYIEIFEPVYKAVSTYASQQDILFLDELNNKVGILINENGVTVPELYYHIATRLEHFLIDEFQDTSSLQWSNLFPMIENALSAGGSLFYVGDIKQAIFRFRGGEVSLFNRLREQFEPDVERDYLRDNRRSQKEIVEFNNFIFSEENLKNFLSQLPVSESRLKEFSQEDISATLGVFKASHQEYLENKKYGHVKVESVECANKAERNELTKERLINLVNELKEDNRFDLRDIAILCRTNPDVELVSSWLVENQIAVESEKTLNLKNNCFISELISFLKFLNSPIDNLSFVGFILGDIFLKASGLKRENIADLIFELNSKASRRQDVYIYPEFRKRYPDIWLKYIEEFFKSAGFVSLYELVVEIYTRFEVFKNFPDQQGFFMHLLELIKTNEEEHPGLGDFLTYLDEPQSASKMYVNSSDADAVKVMTVHKAKGLGFSVLIIPFLELEIGELGGADRATRVSYLVEPDSNGLSLLRLDTKYALLAPPVCNSIRDEYRREYHKAFMDELNIIYVALTRAKNELYIFIPEKPNNVARFLIPKDYFIRGLPRKYEKETEAEVSPLSITFPEYKNWMEFLKEEFTEKETVKKRLNILEGKILHEILAAIGNLSKIDKHAALKEALEHARIAYPFMRDFAKFEATIENLLSAENLKQFFYNEGATVYQEKDIAASSGKAFRIDRLILKEDEIWIIDYKTKQEPVSIFKEQLDEYQKIIKEIYPAKAVRVFIIFLEEASAEELHGQDNHL